MKLVSKRVATIGAALVATWLVFVELNAHDGVSIIEAVGQHRRLAVDCEWQSWNKKTICKEIDSDGQPVGAKFEGKASRARSAGSKNSRHGDGDSGFSSSRGKSRPVEPAPALEETLRWGQNIRGGQFGKSGEHNRDGSDVGSTGESRGRVYSSMANAAVSSAASGSGESDSDTWIQSKSFQGRASSAATVTSSSPSINVNSGTQSTNIKEKVSFSSDGSKSHGSSSTSFRPSLAAFEGRDRARVRAFLSTASLQYAADGLFAQGLGSLDDFNDHPMYTTEATLIAAGVSKASHRRRFQLLLSESLNEWTSGHRVAEAERSRVKRVAVCLTGQVRSFEEVAVNLRDMIVRPLQQLVDLPDINNRRRSQVPSNLRMLRNNTFHERVLRSSSSYGGSTPQPVDVASSNVHFYATLVLKDSLEGKGFRCTKTKHSRQKVTEILASLGAPVYGFIEDDEKSRSGPINGCKAWPGFVQADQMKQCWAMATATEKKQGWQYDYALRVRPDVAYKRSFRLAHWPLFAPLVQGALWHYQQIHGGSSKAANLLLGDEHSGSLIGSNSNHGTRGSHGVRTKHLTNASGLQGLGSGFGDGLGYLDELDPSTGGIPRRTLFAWAPCKCQAKGFESGGKLARKLKRAQDVLWAVPRAAADALFSTTQEYIDRGCAAAPWRETPPPRWLKACPMHVDGRDPYECMFILRLARFNIGYEVYFPPTSSTTTIDDGGWKILRPSWCTKFGQPNGQGASNKGYKSSPLSNEYQPKQRADISDFGFDKSLPPPGKPLPPNWGAHLSGFPGPRPQVGSDSKEAHGGSRGGALEESDATDDDTGDDKGRDIGAGSDHSKSPFLTAAATATKGTTGVDTRGGGGNPGNSGAPPVVSRSSLEAAMSYLFPGSGSNGGSSTSSGAMSGGRNKEARSSGKRQGGEHHAPSFGLHRRLSDPAFNEATVESVQNMSDAEYSNLRHRERLHHGRRLANSKMFGPNGEKQRCHWDMRKSATVCVKADTPLTKAAQKKAAALLAAQAAALVKQEAQREAADEAAELKAQANPGSPAEWEAKYKAFEKERSSLLENANFHLAGVDGEPPKNNVYHVPVHFPEPWFFALQPGSAAAVAAEAAAATAATMAADAAAAEKKAAAEAAAAEAAANALLKKPFRGIPDYGMDAIDALSPAYGGQSSDAAKSASSGGRLNGGKNKSNSGSSSGSSAKAPDGSLPSIQIELARLRAAMELGLMPSENHAIGATSQPLPPAYKPPESMFYSAEEALAASFAPKADLLAPAKDVEAAAAAAEADANSAKAMPNSAEGSLTPNDVGWLKASVTALTTSLAALQSAAASSSPAQGVLDTGGDGGKSSSSGGSTKCLVAKVWSPQHKRMVCDPTGEKTTSKVPVGAHHDSKRAREKIKTYERASSRAGSNFGATAAIGSEDSSGVTSVSGQGDYENSGPSVDLVPGEQAGFGGGWRRRLSGDVRTFGRFSDENINHDARRRQLFKDDAHEKLASDTAGLWVAAKRMNGGVAPPRGSEVYKRLYAKHDEQLRKKFNSVTFPSFSHLLDFSQFVSLPTNGSNHTLASDATNETSSTYSIEDSTNSSGDDGVTESTRSMNDALSREDKTILPSSADTDPSDLNAHSSPESSVALESLANVASIDRDLAVIADEENEASYESPSNTEISTVGKKCREGASRRWDNRKKKMVCPHGDAISSTRDEHSSQTADRGSHNIAGDRHAGAFVDALNHSRSIGLSWGSSSPDRGKLVVEVWAKTPLPRPSQALSDGLTCGTFAHLHTDWCRNGDDLLQVRPKWDTSGISWQAYVCGGGGSSALLGYRPLDSRAASVVNPLLTASPNDDAATSSSTSSGRSSSGDVGSEKALLSCLGGRRLMFVGDSWARQLFLNVVEVIQPSRGKAKDRPRHFHGGVSLSKDTYCKFGGTGAGIDFHRCGWPGNYTWRSRGLSSRAESERSRRVHRRHHLGAATNGNRSMSSTNSGYQRYLTDAEALVDSEARDHYRWGVEVTFLSKGYVDSAALDAHYAKHAAAISADVIVFDVGRWSTVPGSKGKFGRLFLASVDRLRAGLAERGGTLVVVWGGARADASSSQLDPLDAYLRQELLERKPGVVVFDRFRSLATLGESFPHRRLCGHGFSGPITDLHARLLLALLCSAPQLSAQEKMLSAYESSEEASRTMPAPEAVTSVEDDRQAKRCNEVLEAKNFPSWVRSFS